MGCSSAKDAVVAPLPKAPSIVTLLGRRDLHVGMPHKPANKLAKGDDLPLLGIRVVDFGQYIAGSLAAMMLADQGADVIHVDPPTGPLWNSPANSVLNRNKHCVRLNLKDAKDREKAQELIGMADIVIENAPPGRMQNFELGASEMTMGHPGLIYVSLPGFASMDEEFRGVRALEAVILASAGIFWESCPRQQVQQGRPCYSPLPLASVYAGVLAGAAAVAALYGRFETGQGDIIEVPLASALMDALRCSRLDERAAVHCRSSEPCAQFPMQQPLPGYEDMPDPFSRDYQCADHRIFSLLASGHASHVSRTVDLLDCRKEVIGICPLADFCVNRNDDHGDFALQRSKLTQIVQIFESRFMTKTAFEWEQEFADAKVAASAVRTTHEWLHSDHASESGLIVSSSTPSGPMLVPGPLVWLSGSAEQAGHRRTTLPDFKRARVGLPPAEDCFFSVKRRGWLDGTKMLDLSNAIAAPIVGELCARFGAKCVKIDLPTTQYDPAVIVGEGHRGNRGKRSTLIDLSTPQGYAALKELVCWADIVVFNGIDSQLESLGITLPKLQAMNPSVTLYHLSALGGPLGGPRAHSLGYDRTVQSATGMSTHFADSLGTSDGHVRTCDVDAVTGFAGVFAACLALFQRRRTRSAEMAQTSLASLAQMVQLPYCFADGKHTCAQTVCADPCSGEHALYRAYKCKDGIWGFLAATCQHPWPQEMFNAEVSVGHLGLPTTEKPLETYAATTDFEAMAATFRQIGVPFVRIRSFADLPKDPQPERKTFRLRTRQEQDTSNGEETRGLMPCCIRSSNWKVKNLPELPKYGQDTREILMTMCRFSAKDVEDMLASAAASERFAGVAASESRAHA